MYSKRRRLGNKGEDSVVNDLEKKGYSIIGRNYLKKWGEIDIIALKAGKLHFIEVKTVSYKGEWKPEENVHPWKLRKLGRTIETFLLEFRLGEMYEWQCDVACVYLKEKNGGEGLESEIEHEIEYIEDIVL